MERWRGQIAVVTGASSGIGRATCLHLVEAGMKVVALARREDRLKELEEATGGTIKGIRCDISQESEIKEAFTWIDKNLGNVSILVNNAGYLKPEILFTAGDNIGVSQMFNTNVLGLISCSREAISRMVKSEINGHIININSISGHIHLNIPGFGPYSATKHSVTVLTEALRTELSLIDSKIRITSISPGLVFTEMADIFRDKLPNDIPGLESDDVANCVLFAISSPSHANISEIIVQPTGECINRIPGIDEISLYGRFNIEPINIIESN